MVAEGGRPLPLGFAAPPAAPLAAPPPALPPLLIIPPLDALSAAFGRPHMLVKNT